MLKKILFLLAIVIVNVTNAQVKPLNGSTLNYRIIGFQVPQNVKAVTYTLQIALDSVAKADEFERRTIIEQMSSSNKIIETVPTFNMLYTWRVVCKDKAGKIVSKTPLYYFRTGYIKYIDTSVYKMAVYNNTKAVKDVYMMLDNCGVMYDMNGVPVWYLPVIPDRDSTNNKNHMMRDLKPTGHGTITALFEHGIYEFDYDGNVLWRGPLNGTKISEEIQTYHHEFTRLTNGNYLVAGNEEIELEVLQGADNRERIDTQQTIQRDGKRYRKVASGTILEYDKTGKLIWSWKSSSVFNKETINADAGNRMIRLGTHLNSVYMDEQNKVVYVGFRNISKIVKLEYPTGKILDVFEGKIPIMRQGADMSKIATDPFSCQHSCRKEYGMLYVFNNNTMRDPNSSSVAEIYQEPDTTGKGLKKIWYFDCNIDRNTTPGSPVGGSIYAINDTTVLICMGQAGRILIVDKNKNVLWNGFQKFNRGEDAWVNLPQYRVSYVDKKHLYKLLFK